MIFSILYTDIEGDVSPVYSENTSFVDVIKRYNLYIVNVSKLFQLFKSSVESHFQNPKIENLPILSK